MNENTKNILIRGGAVLVGGLVLVLVGKKVIKTIKDKNAKKREEQREEDGQGMGNEQKEKEETESNAYNPASDLATFEKYVHGGNITTYAYKVDALFNKLTDAELCKLDKAHRSKHKDSMWTHLDDELDNCGWFSDCYVESKRRLRNAGCG